MKLKVTKALAKELNKNIKDFYIVPLTLNEHAYYNNVGSIWLADDYGDTTYNKAGDLVFKAWRIDYPANYYACSQYVTTYDLVKLVKGLKVVTLENLTSAFVDAYSI